MKTELQEKIFNRFPKFFANKDLPMTQTCMCWGIDCSGDGWFQLIWNMCEEIEKCLSENPMEYEFRFDQVKSKFAGLRAYHNGNDAIYKITDKYEKLSTKTCEYCGKEGKVVGGSWIYTLCKDCADKNGIEYKLKEF